MLSRLSYTFFALAAVLPYVRADCASYGIDFQNGGNYFINSLDTSNFTTVTEFTGCTGVADVILVAPNEDSWLCSDISTTPDGADQLSTCPVLKSQMYDGSWTIVILDNNGDNPSFAAQRTFQITVGPQATVTYTPTVNITSIVTPSVTSTSTTVFTDATTVPGETVTAASGTAKSTVTITPKRVTSTVITTSTRTFTFRKYTWPITFTTKTASCSVPSKLETKDPWPAQNVLALAQRFTANLAAAKAQTVAPATAPATTTSAASTARAKRDVAVNVANILGRRAVERLLKKRAPDAPTLTITDTNPLDWVTSTATTTTTTTTFIITSTSTAVTTITPSPVTVLTGITTISVTLPTPTTTRTIHTYTVTTVTVTITNPITITKTTTPPSVIASCTSKGGHLV